MVKINFAMEVFFPEGSVTTFAFRFNYNRPFSKNKGFFIFFASALSLLPVFSSKQTLKPLLSLKSANSSNKNGTARLAVPKDRSIWYNLSFKKFYLFKVNDYPFCIRLKRGLHQFKDPQRLLSGNDLLSSAVDGITEVGVQLVIIKFHFRQRKFFY